jgi:hypothetical protein
MLSPVHVEMHDGTTFCGIRLAAESCISQEEWHTGAESVQLATCEQCLLRLFMLGDSARIALERMGRRVEVHDVPAEAEVS